MSCNTLAIQKIDGSFNLTAVSGGLVQTGVSADGSVVWGIDSVGSTYHYSGGSFVLNGTGIASAISVSPDGNAVWILSSQQAGVGGGFSVYYWNGSSWVKVPESGGTGVSTGLMTLQAASSQHVIGTDSKGNLFQYNGSKWTNINLPDGSCFSAAIAPSGDIFAQSSTAKLYHRTYSGAWSQVSGSGVHYTGTYPALITASSATVAYLLEHGYIYSYNSSTNTFVELTSTPSGYIFWISACSDGTLWAVDLVSSSQKDVYKYSGGTWTYKTYTPIDMIFGASKSLAYGLEYSQLCAPSGGKNNPYQILVGLNSALLKTYGSSGINTLSYYQTFMSNYASYIKSICSSGGTLPPYSNFKSMVNDFNGIFTGLATFSCNFPDFTYCDSQPDTPYPGLSTWFAGNCPPNTSVVQFANPTSTASFAEMMNTLYGIGAPTGQLQNGNGWLDILSVPSFGTSTVAEGINEYINKTAVTSFDNFLNDVVTYTAYSSMDCAKLKKQMNFSALLLIGVTVLAIGAKIGAVMVVPAAAGLLFILEVLGAIAAAYTAWCAAVYIYKCGPWPWNNWGNLT